MLGARIAALRRDAGLSQAELAGQLQISPSALGMYEQGRREPSLEGVVAIAQCLGVSADYLLTGKPLTQQDREAIARSATRVKPVRSSGLSREELSVLFAAMLTEP